MSETVNETMNDVTMTDKLTNNDMASNVTGPALSGSEGRSANPSVAMPRVVSITSGRRPATASASPSPGRWRNGGGRNRERGRLPDVPRHGYRHGQNPPPRNRRPCRTISSTSSIGRGHVGRQIQQVARATIHDLQSRGIRPILVGGPACARAAIDDITFPGTDPDVRRRLEERAQRELPELCSDELRGTLRPRRAWNPHNPVVPSARWRSSKLTGRPYSASLPRYRYVIASVQIGLDLAPRGFGPSHRHPRKQMLEVVSSKRWSGSAPIWERPPGGARLSADHRLPGRAVRSG